MRFNEKRWIATVPERLGNKFFGIINSSETDYEELKSVLKEIVEFVRDTVGEDNFFEDDFIDDMDWVDIECDEDADYYINDMYDILDGYSIFLEPVY